MSIISIKEMLKVQETEVKNKTYLVVLGVAAVLFIVAPYIHIFIDKTSLNKVFGFKNLRSFLYVIGLPLSLFFCALLLLYATKYMPKNSPKKYFSTVAFLFLSSSFFQFIWIFWEREDLPESAYYTIISVLSIIMSFSFVKGIMNRKSTILKLQKALDSLSRFSFITVKKNIPKENEVGYKADLINALKDGMIND